jgi:type VI protein secretion system component Hcp
MRALVLVCLLAFASPAVAAFDVFLQVNGVSGSGPDPLYAGWSTVYSFESGLASDTDLISAGRTSFRPIALVKAVDAATVEFFGRLAPGTPLATVKIVVVQRSALRVEMWDIEARTVYFTAQSFSASEGGPVLENISFAAGEIAWSYIEVGLSGDPLTEIYASWNILTNTGQKGTRPPTFLGGHDSDGDGMPDGWELFYGLNPSANDANLDPDGDGMSNRKEYIAHTNPLLAQSVLRVEGIQLAGGEYLIMWQSVPGLIYRVESAPEPGGPWTFVRNVAASVAGFITTTTVSSGPPRTFFRIATPP